MHKKFLIVVSLFYCGAVNAQNYDAKILDSLFARTIDVYIGKKGLESNFYMLKSDTLPQVAQTKNGQVIDYVSREEAVNRIFNAKSRRGTLHFCNIAARKDTIDIDISSWYIKLKRVKKVNGNKLPKYTYFESAKSIPAANLPTCRFVYNRKAKTWEQISTQL